MRYPFTLFISSDLQLCYTVRILDKPLRFRYQGRNRTKRRRRAVGILFLKKPGKLADNT